ncbi:MAG: efflux RND transporter periplasmic adaptor subunit [Alphaproteobacteria bacterium]|nr:efflux RND transporter periplasmic adaptor subunit [Alphaproteobacteria bacterium]
MKVKKIKISGVLFKLGYTVACCALGWYLHGRFAPQGTGGYTMGTPHVLVSELTKGDTSARKKYIAEAQAINAVDIMPQVSGYLEEILFKDGSFVAKDQNIFIIEQRKYQADVQAAEAVVKQLSAEFKRKTTLHKGGYVSDKEKDIAESNLHQAEAALDMARLNLEHTEIKSPIDGYIGKTLITKGNLVSPNSQKLARVVQMNPIRIAFSVSDKERSDFMQKASKAESVSLDVVLPNGQTRSISAQNLFFDNEVNPQTATIPVYVDFPNDDNLLIPGNYVDIYVRFSDKQEALLVPQVALIADVNGTYVLTVDGTGTVEQKYVTLGDVIEDKQIVLSGLNGDEQVIVQGLQKVRAGIQVNTTKVNQSNLTADKVQGEK